MTRKLSLAYLKILLVLSAMTLAFWAYYVHVDRGFQQPDHHNKPTDSKDAKYSSILRKQRNFINRRSFPTNPSFQLCCILPAAARLGNIMFAYSSLVGLALQFNARVSLQTNQQHELSRIFALDFLTSSNATSCPEKRMPLMLEKHASAYDPRFEGILKKFTTSPTNERPDVFYIGPYLQSWRYFETFRDHVKSEFRLQGWVERRVTRTMERVADRMLCTKRSKTNGSDVETTCSDLSVNFVGIHVRRADMGLRRSLERGYTTASKEYLNKAIRFMEEKFKSLSLIFLVASDDLEWCHENIKSLHPLVYTTDVQRDGDSEEIGDEVEEEKLKKKLFGEMTFNAVMDFAFLSSCHHVIMTVGSFGWWAGYLSGGTVLYYRDYPKPSSSIAEHFVADDYYPPHWISLS